MCRGPLFSVKLFFEKNKKKEKVKYRIAGTSRYAYVPRVEIVNRRLGRSNGKVSVLVVFLVRIKNEKGVPARLARGSTRRNDRRSSCSGAARNL